MMQIEEICKSLAECGWKDAMKREQQDASEAFTFITDKLNLPLLTLKMDLQHGGKEAVDDDHRFVNERLLSIALPPDKGEVVHLADCLEDYFSDKVEVRRELERRNTLGSIRSTESLKLSASVVETLDMGSKPSSAVNTPIDKEFHSLPFSLTKEAMLNATSEKMGRPRTGTIKSQDGKEILVPAWCFFSILPFYTSSTSEEERTYAQHFQSKRPVLGLCLKRYSWSADGRPLRNGVRIEIPLEIALPTFVSDDSLGENDGPLYGNFKLVLKSAVCHRGKSIASGHYISLVREETPNSAEHRWLLFDDLASERVVEIDGAKALSEETPYLLFYQVEPIDAPSDSGASTPSTEAVESYFEGIPALNEKLRHSASAVSISAGSIRLVPETGESTVSVTTPGTDISLDESISSEREVGKRDSLLMGAPWKKIKHARTHEDHLDGKHHSHGHGMGKNPFSRSKSRDKLGGKSEEGAVHIEDTGSASSGGVSPGEVVEKGGGPNKKKSKNKGERPKECIIQ